MTRYHFNIFNDVDVLDEEGAEFPDLPAAKAHAIAGGRSMMAEHLVLGRAINLSDRIEITDDAGRVLAVLPFAELVTISGR